MITVEGEIDKTSSIATGDTEMQDHEQKFYSALHHRAFRLCNIHARAWDDDIENRFAYHKPSSETVANTHSEMREKCRTLAHHMNNNCPPGKELSLAITKLEEAMMWANAAIARHQ